MTPKKLACEQLLLLVAILALSMIFATPHLLVPLMARASTAHSSTTLHLPHNPQESYTENVNILDLSFNPECLCIEKGDTVNWTNNDPVIHTLWFVFAENKSTYLLSDPIPPGQSWSHTFTEPEKFTLLYHSFNRLWISGTIKVYMIIGDIDGDGDVDPHDLYLFARAYGTVPPTNPDCDLDCDEDVDSDDVHIFGEKYGKTDP